MPVSLDHIRNTMHVQRTPKDAGLQLTIVVSAYDNGTVSVDGVPCGPPEANRVDSAAWWLNVSERVAMMLAEFQRQVQRQATSVDA